MDGLYRSLEKLLTGELKKCVKEIQERIDLEISVLKARLEQLEVKLQSSASPPNNFDPDVSIVIMGLTYDKDEDLAVKLRELLEEGCACEQIPTPIAMQRLRARDPGESGESCICFGVGKGGFTVWEAKPEIQLTVYKGGLYMSDKVTHRLINGIKL